MIRMLLKFNVHYAYHLNNQVITKIKSVSYRMFSFFRPNDIKEPVLMKSYDVLASVAMTCTLSSTIGRPLFTRYVYHDEDRLG